MGMFGGSAPAAIPMSPQAANYNPGVLGTALQVLFSGASPADAAEHLRELHYTNAMLPARANAFQQWLSWMNGGQGNGQGAPQTAPAQDGAPADSEPTTAPPQVQAPQLPGAPGALNMPSAAAVLGQAPATAPPPAQLPIIAPAVAPPPAQAAGSPFDLNNPRNARMIVGGAAFGMPGAAQALDVAKAIQPDVAYDRGFGYNKKSGAPVGQFHPDLDKGQIPLYDQAGNFAGVKNADGSVQAAAQLAGAVAGAQEAGKAPFTLVDVPQADGSTRKIPLSIAAPALAAGLSGGGGAAGAPGAAPGAGTGAGFGVAQTPAAQALAIERAKAQGEREAGFQGARTAMQQVDDQTNMVAQNLHDMLGETQDPRTGKWVKTKPSMIGRMSTGSQTDLIEHIPFINQSAKDLDAKIETVRNGTSFNSLQAIKNALSAAGDGSSGAIRLTDQTARMLGEINGSLNQDQSGPQFEATVRRHLAQLDALNKARHDMFNSQYQGIRPTTPGQTGPTATYNTPNGTARGYTVVGVKRGGR